MTVILQQNIAKKIRYIYGILALHVIQYTPQTRICMAFQRSWERLDKISSRFNEFSLIFMILLNSFFYLAMQPVVDFEFTVNFYTKTFSLHCKKKIVNLTLSGKFYFFVVKCLQTCFLDRWIRNCDQKFQFWKFLTSYIKDAILDYKNLKILTTDSRSAIWKQFWKTSFFKTES